MLKDKNIPIITILDDTKTTYLFKSIEFTNDINTYKVYKSIETEKVGKLSVFQRKLREMHFIWKCTR